MGMSKRTALLSAVIVTFGLGTLYLGLTMKSPRPTHDPNEWDLIIFTQSWPATVCYTWEKLNRNHTCFFPSQKDLWTIHGIWPTKLGTIGPSFCNKSLVFDPTKIYGIKDKLNDYWTDLEVASNVPEANSSVTLFNTTSHKKESIWFHEWTKHGTCAVTLPALNSEYKYFYQGIEWSEKYNMKDILDKSGIKVNSTTLYVADLWKAVKSILKTNVWIECYEKHDTKEQLLSEIRMCFNKDLNVVDCNGIKKNRRDTPLTNCNLKKPISYLDYIPPPLINSTDSNSTNTNSTSNEPPKVLLRSRRKVTENEWITKNSGHFNRSNSYQPRKNSTFVQNLNRSNTYPYIERTNWDVLTFTQTWPYTFCHTWTSSSNAHTCNLPANRNQWIIHGIWPTKIGSFGPSYCNNQTSFNVDDLKTILPELRNRWVEVKESKTWKNKREGEFWRHEWISHGTCAVSLPNLNSVQKYFKQALDWSSQYPLTELLSRGGISPNGAYPISQIWHTLKAALGKNPRINCYMDKTLNKAYIEEVKLCFDKTLSLVDCDHFRKNKDKPYTDCPLNQDIHYVGAVF